MPQENKSAPKRHLNLYNSIQGMGYLAKRQILEQLGAAESQLAALSATEKRLREALQRAEIFVSEEAMVRENSFIVPGLTINDDPESAEEKYVADARETLAFIRAALAHPVEEAGNGDND